MRGTGEAEKLLKNAKTALWNEYEEIGNYVAIETLAKTVGDKETEKLAREFRKQEERMASFLQKLLPQLTKAVATEEIPAVRAPRHERPRRRRSSRDDASTLLDRREEVVACTTRSSRSTGTKSSGTTRSTPSRSTAAKKSSGTTRSSSRSTGTKSSGTKRASGSSRRTTSRSSS